MDVIRNLQLINVGELNYIEGIAYIEIFKRDICVSASGAKRSRAYLGLYSKPDIQHTKKCIIRLNSLPNTLIDKLGDFFETLCNDFFEKNDCKERVVFKEKEDVFAFVEPYFIAIENSPQDIYIYIEFWLKNECKIINCIIKDDDTLDIYETKSQFGSVKI